MLRYTQYFILIILVIANISFASAVVEEIVDHNVTQSSDNFQDHFSLIENINFDGDLEVIDLDEPNLSSTSGRRFMEDGPNALKVSDFSVVAIYTTPSVVVEMKAKENSFIQRVFAPWRVQYFSIQLMCPF